MRELLLKNHSVWMLRLLPIYGAALMLSSGLSDGLFWLVFGFCVFSIWKIKIKPQLRPKLLWCPLLCLLGWVVVCWIFKGQWELALKFLPKWRWILILFFLQFSFLIFWSEELFKKIVVALSCAALVHSIYCVFQFFVPYNLLKLRWEPLVEHFPGLGFYRPQGFFYVTIVTAATFAIYILFALSFRLFSKIVLTRYQKILIDAAMAAAGLAVVLSFSRGPMLALFASCLVLLAFKSWKYSAMGFVFVVALIAGLASVESPFRKRVVDAMNGTDGAMNQRPVLWAAHMEMFKENPLAGVGYGNNERTSVEFIRPYMHRIGNTDIHPTHAHNTYLQFLAATGVVGLLLLLAVWASFGVICFKVATAKVSAKIDGHFLGISGLTILLFIAITSLMDYLFVGINLYQMVFFMSLSAAAYLKNTESIKVENYEFK